MVKSRFSSLASVVVPQIWVFSRHVLGLSEGGHPKKLKPCFIADPDPAKPTSVDKSSTTSISTSTVSATPHHSQQSTSAQSSKLPVRFPEPPAEYVTHSCRVIQLYKRFV
ncbi:hypothetical protein TNCV_4929781 [Trichonephila clavipes]|nr:hypothetical protein TNCV_4929781 [Trichonephila clavipes]